ncbi:MAG: cytochrome c3 family protein [Bdellovibrionales bacterium]|nr:cytochrome c3 family protein [Bdellovibrionales bacterium]
MAKKLVGALVVLGLLGGLSAFVYALTTNKLEIGYNKGYMPDQPIPFSHELHSGKYKINCQYCHSNVAVSRHSSVPSLNVCMNCHSVVKVGSPWIQKITEAYQNDTSIAWEKVHLLPDHVKFNHSAHIQAGKQCTDCHGQVEKMPVVYQHSSLSMGWCVNCHRQPENNAPVNCGTCHY